MFKMLKFPAVKKNIGTASPVPDAPALQAQELTVRYGESCIIDGLTLSIAQNSITTIVGANGCGKSTLLRALSRLLSPQGGAVLLDGVNLHSMKSSQVAHSLSILPQSPSCPEGLTVKDLVSRGRYPHQGLFQQWSADDERIVTEVLAATGISDLADRAVDSLSGGQRQRAWIALTLAQEAPIILLDEPTSYLDLSHAMDVADLVHSLRGAGKTIVMVVHDLNLAARYSDNIIVMKNGSIIAQGTPEEVFTPEILYDAFDLPAVVIADPVSGTPLIVPVSKTA